MSCDCLKKHTTEAEKVSKQAYTESKIEKTDYIVYEEENKIYYDRKACWEKAGRPGVVREIVFYI